MSNAEDRLYVGADAGGTSVDVRFRSGDREGAFELSGVNVRRDGVGRAVESFIEVVLTARTSAGLDAAPPRTSIVIGAAGGGDRSTCETVQAAVRSGIEGESEVQVMSDATLALHAGHGGNPGAVIIVGTGSVAILRRIDGHVVTRGGLGYILGDEASGYAIGRAAARLLARTIDEGSSSPFAIRIASALGVGSRESLFSRVYDEMYPLQQLAPVAIESAASGDAQAVRLIELEMNGLAGTTAKLDTVWDGDAGIDYCLIGGLASYTFVRDQIARRVPNRWKRVDPMFHRPVDAALAMALQTDVDR